MSSVENSIESNDPLTTPPPFDLDCRKCEKEWIGDCEDHYNNIFSVEYTEAELKEGTRPLFSINYYKDLDFFIPGSDVFWGHPSVANDSEEEYPLSREDKDKSKEPLTTMGKCIVPPTTMGKSKEPPTTMGKCIEPTTTKDILNVKPKRKYVRKNRTFPSNNSKENGELPHLIKKLLSNPDISIVKISKNKGCKSGNGNEADIPSIKLNKKKSGSSSVYEIDNTKLKNESTQVMDESQTKENKARIPVIKLKKKKSGSSSVYEIDNTTLKNKCTLNSQTKVSEVFKNKKRITCQGKLKKINDFFPNYL